MLYFTKPSYWWVNKFKLFLRITHRCNLKKSAKTALQICLAQRTLSVIVVSTVCHRFYMVYFFPKPFLLPSIIPKLLAMHIANLLFLSQQMPASLLLSVHCTWISYESLSLLWSHSSNMLHFSATATQTSLLHQSLLFLICQLIRLMPHNSFVHSLLRKISDLFPLLLHTLNIPNNNIQRIWKWT